MHAITPALLHHDLKAAFNVNEPAGLRALGVLYGVLRGRAWVDDLQQQTCALLQETTYGTIYLAGKWEPETLQHMIARLRRESEVMIGLWSADPRELLLPSNPHYTGIVHDFYIHPPATALAHLADELPANCELRQLDATNFSKLFAKDDLIKQYGSVENTLQTIIGYCLLLEGQNVCEALTGPAINGIREMGIDTRADMRKRGFATLTCAALLQACDRLGYQTFWNCNGSNTASLALARRLGYKHEKSYNLFYWNQTVSA